MICNMHGRREVSPDPVGSAQAAASVSSICRTVLSTGSIGVELSHSFLVTRIHNYLVPQNDVSGANAAPFEDE